MKFELRYNDGVTEIGSKSVMGRHDNFDASANRAFIYAVASAVDKNHSHIGTEHMLYGLIDEESIIPVIERLGGDSNEIEMNLDLLIRPHIYLVNPLEMVLTSRFTKVLDYASEEATERCNPIDAHDLLIGLSREQDGVAWHVLKTTLTNLNETREVVRGLRVETGRK